MATKKAPAKTAVATRSNTSVVSAKEMIAAQIAKLADKTQPASGNVIRVTQDKQFALPDGTKTRDPLQLVIVDFCSRNDFYPGAYDKDNVTPPACFAIGESPIKLVPSNNSPERQADSCVECPNNVFGSAGAGKACKNSRILAVLPPDADADTPMWVLKVSPTAIKGFDGYVNGLASRLGMAAIQAVTTVSFDDTKDYPSLRFSDPEPMDEGLLPAFAGRVEEAQKLITQEPDVSQYGAAPAPKKPAAKKPAARPAVAARR